jgi:hypothetical protein
MPIQKGQAGVLKLQCFGGTPVPASSAEYDAAVPVAEKDIARGYH